MSLSHTDKWEVLLILKKKPSGLIVLLKKKLKCEISAGELYLSVTCHGVPIHLLTLAITFQAHGAVGKFTNLPERNKKKKSVRVAYIIDLSVCIFILKYWSRPCRGRFWSVWCFYVHRISLLILNQQVGKAKAKLNFKFVQTALKHVRRNVLC